MDILKNHTVHPAAAARRLSPGRYRPAVLDQYSADTSGLYPWHYSCHLDHCAPVDFNMNEISKVSDQAPVRREMAERRGVLSHQQIELSGKLVGVQICSARNRAALRT